MRPRRTRCVRVQVTTLGPRPRDPSRESGNERVDKHARQRQKDDDRCCQQRSATNAPPLDRDRSVWGAKLFEPGYQRTLVLLQTLLDLRRDGQTDVGRERLGDLIRREQAGGALVDAVGIALQRA
jgi:hypothetical protein